MPSPSSSSAIANLVSARRKVSATRQAVGLEIDPKVQQAANANLQPVAPSPANGPAYKVGPQQAAVAGQAVPQDPSTASAFVPHPDMIPQDKHDSMLAMVMQHFNGQSPTPAAPPAGPAGKTQRVADPAITAGLAPLADFFQENGRLPSADELKNIQAAAQLKMQLGRAPNALETQLYMAKPPKGSS